jgi:hypothetical protein
VPADLAREPLASEHPAEASANVAEPKPRRDDRPVLGDAGALGTQAFDALRKAGTDRRPTCAPPSRRRC